MRRQANLERSSALTVTPKNIASYFARLSQVYHEHIIHSAMQVFNIDECGFSTRTAARASAKALMSSKGRGNAIDLS